MEKAQLLEFLRFCSDQICELVNSVEFVNSAELAAGASTFATSLLDVCYLDRYPVAKNEIPVTSELDRMESSPLVSAVRRAHPLLPWTASHRMTDGGTEAALAPFNDVLDFDAHGVTVGLLLVGANCEYPLHQHHPQELYLTMSGTAHWRYGGAENLVPVPPNQLVYNHPSDLHRVVAGPDPVLALYILW